MLYQIKSFATETDIVSNHISTYPIELQKAKSKNEFQELLCKIKPNFLCYHLTRLTKREVKHIQKYGLEIGLKDHLYKKVLNLPQKCKFFKKEMLRHVEDLGSNEINDKLYTYHGCLDLNSQNTSTPFLQNWGGEAIYNFYDHGDGYCDNYLKRIYTTLKSVSRPYLVILRVDTNCFDDMYEITSIYDACKENSISKVEGRFIVKSAKVVKLIDLTKNSVKFQ
jgi:hypothetical protein